MICARARGVWLLVFTSAALAQSGGIVITPQGQLTLGLTAGDEATASKLGAALGKSLGCALSNVETRGSDVHFTYRAACSGVFARRGDVVEGQLKLAGFRQALIKAKVDEIALSIAMPCAPYVRAALPASWDYTCRSGWIYRTASLEPHELPTRPVRVAAGYRRLELATMFGPLPAVVLLAIALLAYLNRAAARGRHADPRALWFAYVRAWSLGLTGLYLFWVAWWAGITGSLANHMEVWALYSVFNGGSVVGGRLAALGLYTLAILFVGVLSTVWSPAVFRGLHRWKPLLLAPLGLILPAAWMLNALAVLQTGRLGAFAVRVLSASGSALLVGIALRSGRKSRAEKLTSGTVAVRVSGLARRAGAELREIRVVPIAAGLIVEPLEAEEGRVALSDYVIETLDGAEIEAAVARRWSLPFASYTTVRDVLAMLGALLGGAVVGFAAALAINIPIGALLLALRIHSSIPTMNLALPLTIGCAAVLHRLLERGLHRRAGRRAAALIGDADSMQRAAAKLAASELPPWKWGRAAAKWPAVSTEPNAAVVKS